MDAETIALNGLGALIVTYVCVAARYVWAQKRPVSWDYERQQWRSSQRVYEDRRR